MDFPIPANDDALKSIDLITGVIAAAIIEGEKEREIAEATQKVEKEKRAMDEGDSEDAEG